MMMTIYLDDAERGIAAHANAIALPNLTTTTATVTDQFLTAARPIILAMFGIEDAIHPVGVARLADPLGYVSYARMSPQANAWQEAQNVASKAVDALKDILEGIRENVLCDAFVGTCDGATDDEADAIDEFNDDLRRSVMTVDAAVRMVGDAL